MLFDVRQKMKIGNQTPRETAFTLVECLVVLTILLIIAGFVARVMYREEFREVDRWFAETFGFSHLWITMPAIAIYVIYRIRTRKKKHSMSRRFTLPQD